MTDVAVHASLDEKTGQCIVGWQGAEQYAQKKMTIVPKGIEMANPTLLVLNLSKVPVASVSTVIENGGPEEAKNNKGVRVTFLVLKVITPGWTWVGDSPVVEAKDKKRAGAGVAAPKSESKDKLNAMMGENLLMHSYDTSNIRGVYVKSGRSEECLCITPGMVLSMMVWGRGLLSVFKEQKGEDLYPFDISVAQLSIKSVGCKGMETGNMLDVKSYSKSSNPALNLLGIRLMPSAIAKSLQESAVMRSRYLDGTHITPEDTTAMNINHAWLKGSISATVSIVKVAAGQGTFAIGPDDVLRFHVTQTLGDLPCAQMTIKCDTSAYGGDLLWVCKLFNVLALAGAMELIVIMDSYKASKMESEGEDTVLEGFARPNVAGLIEAMLTNKTADAGMDFVKETFGEAAINMATFKLDNDVVVALDTRVSNKKKSITETAANKSTLVHPSSAWERGHALHFFFGGRLVHYVVLPIATDAGNAGSNHVLSTIAVKWDDDIEMGPGVANKVAEVSSVEKKRKRAAAVGGESEAA